METIQIWTRRARPLRLPVSACAGVLLDLANIDESEYHAVTRLLHDDERERAQRFVYPVLAKKFALCRVLCRFAIGSVVGCDLAQIRFVYTRFGRPFICDSAVDFNLSHSQDLAVLCWSAASKVGVDIEYIDADFQYQPILPVCADEDEIKWVLAGDSLLRFYQLWTAKEAIGKCSGEGVATAMPQLICHEKYLSYPGKRIIYMQPNPLYSLSLCLDEQGG